MEKTDRTEYHLGEEKAGTIRYWLLLSLGIIGLSVMHEDHLITLAKFSDHHEKDSYGHYQLSMTLVLLAYGGIDLLPINVAA